MNDKLDGKIILVTRPRHQSESLCHMIEQEGGTAIRLPLLEILPVEPDPDLERKISEITRCDAVIFISRNAVNATLEFLKNDLHCFSGKPIYAVGRSTAGALEEAGLDKVIYPEEGADSESLLALPSLQSPEVMNKKIMIFRGQGGRPMLADNLRQRGARVDYVEVYRRISTVYDRESLDSLWLDHRPDLIVISSGEGLQNLFDMVTSAWKQELLNTPLVVLGRRMAEQAERMGFTGRIVLADEASDDGLMKAIRRSFGVEQI